MSFSEKQKEMREKLAKDAIYEAAVSLIVEQGFDHLTMNDIAQKTGMATGTIYNYFANKESLFYYIHSRLHEIIREKSQVIAEREGDALEKLHLYVREMALFCSEHQVVFNIADKLGIKDRITPEEKQGMIDHVVNQLKTIIDDGIRQKKFKKVNSAKVAKVFFFTLIGSFEVECFFNCEHMIQDCNDMLEIFSEYLTDN